MKTSWQEKLLSVAVLTFISASVLWFTATISCGELKDPWQKYCSIGESYVFVRNGGSILFWTLIVLYPLLVIGAIKSRKK